MKIAIIGSPGSGKSFVAKTLRERLSLPLYHLDQYFWKPGWQRPDRAEFARVHDELCDKPTWIIDGMALRHLAYRLEKADIILFMDVPWWRCIWRVFKRAAVGLGTIRDSSAPGCPERMPNREFLAYLWKFHRDQRRLVWSMLTDHKGRKKIFIVKGKTELLRVIEEIVTLVGSMK